MEEEAAAAEGRRSSLEVCFGDRQSTLLDEFERLAFEAHLQRTILRRSFSEPSPARFIARTNPNSHLGQCVVHDFSRELPQPQSRERKPSKLVRALQRLFEALVSVAFGRRRESAGRSGLESPEQIFKNVNDQKGKKEAR